MSMPGTADSGARLKRQVKQVLQVLKKDGVIESTSKQVFQELESRVMLRSSDWLRQCRHSCLRSSNEFVVGTFGDLR